MADHSLSNGLNLARASVLLVALLSTFISGFLFLSSRSLEPETGKVFGNLTELSSEVARRRKIKTQQLFKRLEYMVWERERKSLAIELSQLLQDDINLAPFNAQAWRDLTFVTKFSSMPMEQRAWVLERAVILSKWNVAELTKLTHHCVNEYRAFQQSAEALCDGLIRQLSTNTHLPVLAKQLGVPPTVLVSVLEAEGLSGMINK